MGSIDTINMINLKISVLTLCLLCTLLLPNQALYGESFGVSYLPGDKFRITEKADLRRFENGRFIGLAYREVRGVLDVLAGNEEGGARRVTGDFYVFEETKHKSINVARRIDHVVPVNFLIKGNGQYVVAENLGYPSLRSFPVFPAKKVEQGEKWQDFGERVVEPFRDERFTRVRFYCDYQYSGTEIIEGNEYIVLKAQYAMRYKPGQDPYGDERIRGISGKHLVTIYFDPYLQRPHFMRDQMDEVYQLAGGGTIAYKGFILTWFDNIVTMDRSHIVEEVREQLKESGVEDISVEEKKEGVALTLNRIHFVADQAVVLPREKERLKSVARALKKIESRSFLVVGHTARIGSAQSQLTLSVERAKAIVDYLVSQGLEAERFLYEGRGGSEPVAANDIEENMAKNRRVEIIILED